MEEEEEGGGGAVGGVILEESLLLEKDTRELSSAARTLLGRLRHWNLRCGIVAAAADDSSTPTCDRFLDTAPLGWPDFPACLTLVYVASSAPVTRSFVSPVVTVLVDAADDACTAISKLEELPLAIFRLNARVVGENVIKVGYSMKPSREHDFAKRGAFPISPSPNGLMFMPLTFELPLPPQLRLLDAVLHKATDDIVSIDLTDYSSPAAVYTSGMQNLQRYLEHDSHCSVIDPFDKIALVLDRLKIQQTLLGLHDLNAGTRSTIRGPRFLQVNKFDEPDLLHKMSQAHLSLPCIVKPQVACGVSDAHSMAIIFRVQDFKDLKVPLPAVIQEYVDHSSTLYKIYCLGGKVFYAVKKSIPNADVLTKFADKDGLEPLLFDSLKSLPTSNGQDTGSSPIMTNDRTFDIELVNDAANWLWRKLDMTVFGFDVVIEESTGDHVVVDVNYLPSFKEVEDDVAVPAFWDAIRRRFETTKT